MYNHKSAFMNLINFSLYIYIFIFILRILLNHAWLTYDIYVYLKKKMLDYGGSKPHQVRQRMSPLLHANAWLKIEYGDGFSQKHHGNNFESNACLRKQWRCRRFCRDGHGHRVAIHRFNQSQNWIKRSCSEWGPRGWSSSSSFPSKSCRGTAHIPMHGTMASIEASSI